MNRRDWRNWSASSGFKGRRASGQWCAPPRSGSQGPIDRASRTIGRGVRSDHIRLQRRKAVEADRRVCRGVGPRSLDQHLGADLERDWQEVRLLLVQHVDRVAAWPGDDARAERVLIKGRANWIADHL